MDEVAIHRLTAFTTEPSGGNPAGVVITDRPLPEDAMQAIAADVGYSETAFLVPTGARHYDVRYFAPAAEVSFCGHATIASGVLLGSRGGGAGSYVFSTRAGDVRVDVADDEGGPVATLTSVEPAVADAAPALLAEVMAAFALTDADLDHAYPPAVAFAGARHLVLVLADRQRLAEMAYDFERVRELMADSDLTTIALLWRANDVTWHARNAFAVGGVVEDPATGAAAAAFGAYLRERGALLTPGRFTIIQGEDMGRPSYLRVTVPSSGGIAVSGHATAIPS